MNVHRYIVVCHLIICLGASLAGAVAAEQSQAQNATFYAARGAMGGSVLEPLIRKCNNLSDSDIPVGMANVKSAIMAQLSGSIGPVYYSQHFRTITTKSYQSVAQFQGYTDWGATFSGDLIAPVSSTRTKAGGWKVNTPSGFKKGFDKMQFLARRQKHARACAEVGACIFVEAIKEIGMDDRKAIDYFKKAAEYGDCDGMFMYAFCLYCGIGKSKPDLQMCYDVLMRLKDSMANEAETKSVCQGIVNTGWVGRRLSECGERVVRKTSCQSQRKNMNKQKTKP